MFTLPVALAAQFAEGIVAVPYAECGGVRLYYEESGSGFPVVFIHEFAGDLWSWEPQLRHFARRYRCIAFNARGYPPSDVPDDPAAYSQDDAVADIVAVLAECGVQRAHIVGLSMGAFASLHLGLGHPRLAASLVLAGVGYGALLAQQPQFRLEVEATAARFEAQGMADAAAAYAATPHRAAMRRKDPRGFDEFTRRLSEHSTDGSVRTMRGVQGGRPAFDELALEACRVPALILAGDEDTPSLEPSLYLRRALPNAALSVLPRTGHAMNLEEPDAFNALVDDFLATVDAGRWETGEVSGDPIL